MERKPLQQISMKFIKPLGVTLKSIYSTTLQKSKRDEFFRKDQGEINIFNKH